MRHPENREKSRRLYRDERAAMIERGYTLLYANPMTESCSFAKQAFAGVIIITLEANWSRGTVTRREVTIRNEARAALAALLTNGGKP